MFESFYFKIKMLKKINKKKKKKRKNLQMLLLSGGVKNFKDCIN